MPYRMTLMEFFESVYLSRRCLSPAGAEQYRVTIRLLDRWHKSPVLCGQLSESFAADFLRWLRSQGRSARTVNGKRTALLTLWRLAFKTGHATTPAADDLFRVPEPKRIPTAWRTEEVRRLLDGCRDAEPMDGWDSRHWQALILTIYDTSLRISALLQVASSDLSDGLLLCRAEHQKQNADTLHKLSSQTLETIERLPPADLLFPWPLSKRAIWPAFKAILTASRLPATRRDLFHKIRRTSYTHVMIASGKEAATRHAGHGSDMSRFYFDPRLANGQDSVDVLPRP